MAAVAISIPVATEIWQDKFEALTGSTDNMEMLSVTGQLTRVSKLVVNLDSRVMVITDFACKKLVIPMPAALVNGGGIGNVELIDLGNDSVAPPGGGPLGPNPNGLSVYIQNFPAADRPRVTLIFQSLLASLFTNYFKFDLHITAGAPY